MGCVRPPRTAHHTAASCALLGLRHSGVAQANPGASREDHGASPCERGASRGDHEASSMRTGPTRVMIANEAMCSSHETVVSAAWRAHQGASRGESGRFGRARPRWRAPTGRSHAPREGCQRHLGRWQTNLGPCQAIFGRWQTPFGAWRVPHERWHALPGRWRAISTACQAPLRVPPAIVVRWRAQPGSRRRRASG
jgi:hypothetical protein